MIKTNLTAADIAKYRDTCLVQLQHAIRDCVPPADGAVSKIIRELEALAKVCPADRVMVDGVPVHPLILDSDGSVVLSKRMALADELEQAEAANEPLTKAERKALRRREDRDE